MLHIMQMIRRHRMSLSAMATCLGVMACRPEAQTASKTEPVAAKAVAAAAANTTSTAAATATHAVTTSTTAPAAATSGARMSDKLTTEGIRLLQGQPGVVRLTWTTQSEDNSFGFNVMRAKGAEGPFAPVNERPLMGAGVSSTAQNYAYFDQSVKVGEVYYYFIRQIDLDGTTKDFKEWTSRVTVNRLNLDRATSATAAMARANAVAARANAVTTGTVGMAGVTGAAAANAGTTGTAEATKRK